MILRQGTKSNDVAFVQRALNIGTLFTPKLIIDGIYGPRTAARVTQFQNAKKLSPDGTAGPFTLNALFTGVQLTGTITVKRKISGSPISKSLSITGDGASSTFTPILMDPRDIQWSAQVKAFQDWLALPFPKGKAPLFPLTAPPSLSRPPVSLSIPPVPSQRVIVSEKVGRSSAGASVPPPGVNFDASVAGGFKRGELKFQEFKLKLDFAKVTGLIDTNLVQQELQTEINDKGDLEVESSLTVTPFQPFGPQGRIADLKLTPFLETTLNSSFEASVAAPSLKIVATFRPFGSGFEVDIGGKVGPKVKLSHNEDGKAFICATPLAGEGNVSFTFSF